MLLFGFSCEWNSAFVFSSLTQRAVFHLFSLYLSVFFLSLLPSRLPARSLTSCALVSFLLFFCSTCPPLLKDPFNNTFPVHILHIRKPAFSLLCSLPPHSLPFFLFLPPSLLLILSAFSLQQCSVWFDLSVCRAATPPCFHLTRADEACRHFSTVYFQSRVCFLESLCVPDHCLHYHTSTMLLSPRVPHHHLHADSTTHLLGSTERLSLLSDISNLYGEALQEWGSLWWRGSHIQSSLTQTLCWHLCVSDFNKQFVPLGSS